MTTLGPDDLEAGELVEFKLGSGWWVWATYRGFDDQGGVMIELKVEVAVTGGTEMQSAVMQLPPHALLRRLSK